VMVHEACAEQLGGRNGPRSNPSPGMGSDTFGPSSSRDDGMTTADGRLRGASLTKAVDSGVAFLEGICAWEPREGILNLPVVYFYMMVTIGLALVNSLKEAVLAEGMAEWCTVSPGEVLQLFRTIVDILRSGKLPQFHASWRAAEPLSWYCEELERLVLVERERAERRMGPAGPMGVGRLEWRAS